MIPQDKGIFNQLQYHKYTKKGISKYIREGLVCGRDKGALEKKEKKERNHIA